MGIVWLHERTLIALPGPAITGSLLIVAGVVVLARSATGSGPAPAARPAAEPPAGRPAPAGGETRSRILIGTDTYPPHVNGAAVFTRRLAHGLACRGHDVHVVCRASASTRAGGTQPEGPVLVHRLPARPVPRHAELSYCPPWRVRSQTARTVEQVKPDVIHIQTHYLIGRTLTRLAGRSGIPLVATNHFMPDTLLAPLRLPRFLGHRLARWGWRDCARVLGRAHAVTAPTPTAARLLQDNGLHRPVTAISCGIDLDRFTTQPGPGSFRPFGLPDRPTILFVGRLDPRESKTSSTRWPPSAGTSTPSW